MPLLSISGCSVYGKQFLVSGLYSHFWDNHSNLKVVSKFASSVVPTSPVTFSSFIFHSQLCTIALAQCRVIRGNYLLFTAVQAGTVRSILHILSNTLHSVLDCSL